MDSKLKAIRGLSIANIILLSIVVLIAIGAGLLCNVVLNMLLGQPDIQADMLEILASDPNYAAFTAAEVTSLLSGIVWSLIAVYVIFCGIMIVGCAITLSRIKNRPNEIGSCMGWSAAGIVLSIMSGLLISLILFIIATVCISKAKSLVAEGKGISEGFVGSTQAPTEPAKVSAPAEPAKIEASEKPAKEKTAKEEPTEKPTKETEK